MTAAWHRPYRSCPNDLGTHRVPRREERVATGHAVVEGIEVSTDHWIGGTRVSSAETFVDVSPIDEMPIAEVARGGAPEADRAVAAAREGFAVWGSMPAKERAEVLHRIADGVEARVPELAAVETRDNGSLLRSMRNSVMPRVARNFRFFADHLLTLGETKDHDGFAEQFEWDPSGVTAVITPWNAPLMLATWRVAPALAAGNAVILKPPEWAPLTASMLADIAHDAGLPDGAFNVLQGIGEEAGAALTAHPGVDRIAFTGSVPTGKLVAQAAGANLTPASLELGGKSPFVAFADADLDAVVKQAVNQFDNAGQVCLAGTRLLVEASIHDEFLDRFTRAAADDRAGRPTRRGHRDRPADHPRTLRARRRIRPTRQGRRCPCGLRRWTQRRARGPVLPAHAVHRCAGRLRDPDAGGLRPGPHPAVVRRRGRSRGAGERHAVRPGRDPVHGRSAAAPNG